MEVNIFFRKKMRGMYAFVLCVSITFPAAGQFNQNPRKIEYSSDTASQFPVRHIGTSAQFPGGMAAFYKYVKKKFRYPREAKRLGIEGKVFILFTIDKDGSIPSDSVRIAKGLCKPCDEEALRIIRESPNWISGRLVRTNEPAAQRMIIPIFFKK